MLSTFPFVALLAVLGVMTIAMIIAAWPGSEREAPRKAVSAEVGTAARGWLQEAQREMH